MVFQYLRRLVQRKPCLPRLPTIQLGKIQWQTMAEALQMLESQVDWTEQLMAPYLKASKPVDHNGNWDDVVVMRIVR